MPQVRHTPESPESVSKTLRAKSNYAHATGFAPFYHAWLADLPRLCSGASCWALVLICLLESLGRPHKKTEPMMEWTKDLTKDWLAAVCRVDRRSLDRDIRYLESSGMAEVKHNWGTVSIRLCFKRWPKLPDYSPALRLVQVSRSA